MNKNSDILTELTAISPDLPHFPEAPYRVPVGYFDRLADLLLEKVQELDQLSFLDHVAKQPVMEVPQGYFDQLPGILLNKIKAGDSNSVPAEDPALSPELLKASAATPYEVPAGYFDMLPNALLDRVKTETIADDPTQELESLSPLLAGIGRKTPYEVPTGYFDQISVPVTDIAAEAPVVQMGARRNNWLKYAAAAVTIGVIAASVLWYNNARSPIDASKNPDAWVASNLKKVSNQEIENYIQLTSDPVITSPPAAPSDEAVDVQELLKDVPTDALENFVTQSGLAEDEDLLFN